MNFKDVDAEPIECVCQDCGKKFKKGDEGDNEIFCLKCCYLSEEEIWKEADSYFPDEEY